MKKILEKNIRKKCAVCNKNYITSDLDLNPCPYCGWYNDAFCEENPDKIIYRNLISFNKAKQLHSEGKPFVPNLDEFIEALYFYSEMQFEYNGTYYAVELIYDKNKEIKIRLFNSQTKKEVIYNDDEDFKYNAKVEGALLKDVWEKTTDRYWLQ